MKNTKKQEQEVFCKPLRERSLKVFAGMIVMLVFLSCDFDFPHENQEEYYTTGAEIHFETGSTGGYIQLTTGNISGSYQVVVYPRWMDIQSFEGKIVQGECTIPFDFRDVDSFMNEERIEGYIFIRLGDEGVFKIVVSYGKSKTEEPPVEGQVPLYCSTAEMDFGIKSNMRFTIANNGQVSKSWYIDNIPAWLSLSATSGTLNGGESLDLICTINRAGMQPGEYSQIINVESNYPQLSHGILVRMTVGSQGGPSDSSKTIWFDGVLKDAYYRKATGMMYLLTESPNKLLVKTDAGETFTPVTLGRIPNCIDVSADGKTIAIGYNQAYVDLFSAETLERIKQVETDCVPFDLVLGENGWCYLAPDEDQWVHFYSLNLETGVTFRSSSYTNFYEKTLLVKMPGKPLIYATCTGLSPQGLQIVNIEKGAANDTVPRWHEETGNRIWISNDGSRIIAGDKEVHPRPDYSKNIYQQDLPKLGKIVIPRNYIRSLDYNEKLKCYFAAGSDYVWTADNGQTIYQVDEISLSAVKSIKVNNYPGTLSGRNNPPMDVHYVFSDSQGTKLYAIKNVERYLEMHIWALEIIDLPLN